MTWEFEPFDVWFRAVAVRGAYVLVLAVSLAAILLPISGFDLLIGGLWTAAGIVTAQAWVMERRIRGQE